MLILYVCHFFIITTTSRGAVDRLTRKIRKKGKLIGVGSKLSTIGNDHICLLYRPLPCARNENNIGGYVGVGEIKGPIEELLSPTTDSSFQLSFSLFVTSLLYNPIFCLNPNLRAKLPATS